MKIRIDNRADMQAVAGILVANGYMVRVVKVKDKGRVTAYLEAVTAEIQAGSNDGRQELQNSNN